MWKWLVSFVALALLALAFLGAARPVPARHAPINPPGTVQCNFAAPLDTPQQCGAWLITVHSFTTSLESDGLHVLPSVTVQNDSAQVQGLLIQAAWGVFNWETGAIYPTLHSGVGLNLQPGQSLNYTLSLGPIPSNLPDIGLGFEANATQKMAWHLHV